MDTKSISFTYEPHRPASETSNEYQDRVTKEFYLQLKKHLKNMDFSNKVMFRITVGIPQ